MSDTADGLPTLMRAQMAAEYELAHAPARFRTDVPSEPGLYLARIEIMHNDVKLYTRRSFEEFDGAQWVHVGFNGTTGGRVTGWLRVED